MEGIEDKKGRDNSVLDLAFAMDCTGSMGSYIESARSNIRQIVEDIVSSEKADVQLALVEYRDHPPQDSTFVTRVNDFTGSVSKMKKWLESCSASGGGDTPEAVADALHDLTKLNWRQNSTKICVFIADAPPHGLSAMGDSFPNGCPVGLDPMKTIKQIAQKGITLYMVGCEPSITPYKTFFCALAHATGGQYVPLSSASLLRQVIVGGAQEEISLEHLLADCQDEVCREVEAMGIVDEKEISNRLHHRLKSKGVKTKQLRRNNAALEEVSKEAMTISDLNNMQEVQGIYKPSEELPSYAHAPMGLAHCSPMLRAGSMPAPGGAPVLDMCESMPMYDAMAPLSMPEVADSYSNVEDEISYNQVQRIVKKTVVQRNLKK